MSCDSMCALHLTSARRLAVVHLQVAALFCGHLCQAVQSWTMLCTALCCAMQSLPCCAAPCCVRPATVRQKAVAVGCDKVATKPRPAWHKVLQTAYQVSGLAILCCAMLCYATLELQAVHQYQQLRLLLQGEQPRHLLPPCPQGYIILRARALAEGPCMNAFEWNSGSGWGNKPWSSELPTDSALVFYLFAAFLEVSCTVCCLWGQHSELPIDGALIFLPVCCIF